MPDLNLTSPAFDDGAPIPREHGYHEGNTSPPLAITGVPPEAASLAIIMDDPDAREPAGKIWDHWVMWNIPPESTSLPSGWDAAAGGAVEGRNDFGSTGYGGPAPPDGEHTYRFLLYALDASLELDPDADADRLRRAMEGRVLAEATLTGTFAP